MQTYHALAECHGCGLLYGGPDPAAADKASNGHATSRARDAVHHASSVRIHPTRLCTNFCRTLVTDQSQPVDWPEERDGPDSNYRKRTT